MGRWLLGFVFCSGAAFGWFLRSALVLSSLLRERRHEEEVQRYGDDAVLREATLERFRALDAVASTTP